MNESVGGQPETPCWDTNGSGICQGCARIGPGTLDRGKAILYLRASGWHYNKGVTHNFTPYEMLLCPQCARDEKKRAQKIAPIQQDALPIDWESFQVEVRHPGSQSL
jgi:hypothetical protein